MSAFTQGFKLGIFNGMANLYAGMCNFWGFGGFGGFGFPALYNYSSFNLPAPSLFMPMNFQNTLGFGGYDAGCGFNSAPLYTSSIFTSAYGTPSYNYAGFDNFSLGQTNLTTNSLSSAFKADTVKRAKSSSNAKINDMDYDTMLKFVLKSEGGYNPNDCGQASNKGVQQTTYDSYRKGKNLPTQDVKNITDEEVKDLYYTMYYKKSGADKISDKRLALYVFDTAVNMGVSAAKDLLSKCGNDPAKFNKLRIEKYESIAANNADKKQYLTGWKNRVANSEAYANEQALA